MHLAGVGGAFGGREDLSMQIHACLLALHTEPAGEDGLQPRGVVLRPRPPAPGADAVRARRDARRATSSTCAPRIAARRRRLRLELDRGRARTRPASRPGPYAVPNARIDAHVVYTNNPPCGAMRGFGAVQVALRRTRRRWTSSPRRSAWIPSSCGCATRCEPGDRAADRPGRRRARARRASCSSALRRDAAPARRRTAARPARLPGRRRQHDARRGRRGAASASRSASRTSASRRASTTTRPPASRARCDDGEPLVEVHSRRGRGRAGRRHRAWRQIARTELGIDESSCSPADTARSARPARRRRRARPG